MNAYKNMELPAADWNVAVGESDAQFVVMCSSW